MKREGLSDCDIAAALGVCKQTFSKWKNHPETNLQRTLSKQLKKAEATYKEQLIQTIRAAALAKNSNWTAAAWLLERKYPDDFRRTGLANTPGSTDLLLPWFGFGAVRRLVCPQGICSLTSCTVVWAVGLRP